jgi:hypothetical protein
MCVLLVRRRLTNANRLQAREVAVWVGQACVYINALFGLPRDVDSDENIKRVVTSPAKCMLELCKAAETDADEDGELPRTIRDTLTM